MVCVTSTARADNLEEAKIAFAAGKAAFERGDYEQALAQFNRANLLAPAPSLSYNIGKTYEKMGRYHDAVLAFERYLELAGPPQNDDDKKFQEELRGRIELDKKTPDQPLKPAQPVPPPAETRPATPPPQPYTPQPYGYNPYAYPNPYAYNPYGGLTTTPKSVRLASARRKRNTGVTTFIIGGVFTVVGLALTVDSVLSTHPLTDFDHCVGLNCGGNIIEIAFGVPFLIAGPILVAVGAANWGRSQADMNRIAKEPEPQLPQPLPPPSRTSGLGAEPAAMLFKSPTFHF